MSDRLRELAYRIWGKCLGVSGETTGDSEPPIKLPDPPEDEGGFTESEMPKVGSRDAPGG